MTYIYSILLVIVVLSQVTNIQCNRRKQSAVVTLSDAKEFKQILKSKRNVMIGFISSPKQAEKFVRIYRDAAEVIRGEGTMVLVDCSGDGKKLCRKMKANPDPHDVRHFRNGEFHKAYDRKIAIQSIVNFMRDPTGDLPWEEDSTAKDIVHLPNLQSLQKLLKKEKRGVMIMFYAPWCGFCKKMKPDYSEAATEVKDIGVMAAIDINRPENAMVGTKFNITGYPTLTYFEKGEAKIVYEGENRKENLVEFMRNPDFSAIKKRNSDWGEEETDVKHLTAENFDKFIQKKPSVLVMFYAPWCGHCKKLKPEYNAAATMVKELKIGVLVAVDATKEPELASKFNIQSYPTLKYFKDGKFEYDTPKLRDTEKLVKFMKYPQPPGSPPPPEYHWPQVTDVVHLTTDSYKTELRIKRHSLVMYYAPWCFHCRNVIPEYIKAADEMRAIRKLKMFAAVDCTIEPELCQKMGIRAYPTFKYYHYLVKATSDYNGERKAAGFVKYMTNAEDHAKYLINQKEMPKKLSKDEL